MIVQCCDCKKIRLSGQWKAFQVAVPRTIMVSHTYCPICLEKALYEIDQYHQDQRHEHCTHETHAA